MSTFGSQSMVETLKRVLVRRPDTAFGDAEPDRWHYVSQPNLEGAQAEHDAFVAILRDAGCEVLYHETPLPGSFDVIWLSHILHAENPDDCGRIVKKAADALEVTWNPGDTADVSEADILAEGERLLARAKESGRGRDAIARR